MFLYIYIFKKLFIPLRFFIVLSLQEPNFQSNSRTINFPQKLRRMRWINILWDMVSSTHATEWGRGRDASIAIVSVIMSLYIDTIYFWMYSCEMEKWVCSISLFLTGLHEREKLNNRYMDWSSDWSSNIAGKHSLHKNTSVIPTHFLTLSLSFIFSNKTSKNMPGLLYWTYLFSIYSTLILRAQVIATFQVTFQSKPLVIYWLLPTPHTP